jgi:hypothetical protein
MGGFALKDLLEAVGPTASLIFAAWIFLSFLQQRYVTAYEHYRQLIAEFRSHEQRDRRRESLGQQVLEYKRRCEQMRLATQVGVLAAICLISAIVLAAVNAIAQVGALKYLCAAGAIGGLLLVIWAAILVLMENARLQIIIDSDLSDIPDLRTAAANQGRGGELSPHSAPKS